VTRSSEAGRVRSARRPRPPHHGGPAGAPWGPTIGDRGLRFPGHTEATGEEKKADAGRHHHSAQRRCFRYLDPALFFLPPDFSSLWPPPPKSGGDFGPSFSPPDSFDCVAPSTRPLFFLRRMFALQWPKRTPGRPASRRAGAHLHRLHPQTLDHTPGGRRRGPRRAGRHADRRSSSRGRCDSRRLGTAARAGRATPANRPGPRRKPPERLSLCGPPPARTEKSNSRGL